jgi:hypothetical protein
MRMECRLGDKSRLLDAGKVDMTKPTPFSTTHTYIHTIDGLAFRDRMIRIIVRLEIRKS